MFGRNFKTHHFLEFLLGLSDPLPVIAVHNKDQPLTSMMLIVIKNDFLPSILGKHLAT